MVGVGLGGYQGEKLWSILVLTLVLDFTIVSTDWIINNPTMEVLGKSRVLLAPVGAKPKIR